MQSKTGDPSPKSKAKKPCGGNCENCKCKDKLQPQAEPQTKAPPQPRGNMSYDGVIGWFSSKAGFKGEGP